MTGIQLDPETGDLQVKNKGLTIGETSEQCQYLILASHPGEWKETPTLGVGIGDYTNETDITALRYSIRENLKADGCKVSKIDYKNGKLTIEASYGD